MNAYEITHTHDGGTTLEDSSKGDGALAILRGIDRRWRWHPEVGVYVRGTRDRDADRALITASVAALEAAGHTVTQTINNTPRPAAARRTDAAARAADKAAALDAAAGRAERTADARRAAADAVAGWEPGQPILRGHHSERGHRRAVERMHAHDAAGFEAARQAESLAERADGVRAHAAHADDPRAMLRRIETLTAAVRRSEREQPGTTGQRAEDLARWIAQDTEEIEHLSGVLAKLAEAGEFVAWTRGDFQRGDQVYASPGVWVPVLRVNAKSVTVPWIIMAMDGRATDHTDRVPFDKISGRRRAGVQVDAPNGEPRTLTPVPAASAPTVSDDHQAAPGEWDPWDSEHAARTAPATDAGKRARRVASVAAKLAAESFRAEPPVSIELTDEAIRARLAPCVKPPAADLHPEIRTAYLAELAGWEREHGPLSTAVFFERHRASVTQGEVSVWYGGELIGRFGDDVRLCESGSNGRGPHKHDDGAVCFGGFHGRPDAHWIGVAERWAAARAGTDAADANGDQGDMFVSGWGGLAAVGARSPGVATPE